MIEFGTTLRAAREAKGYTAAQIAEITHLAPTTVVEMENEDFRRIPAAIYGRGFVKLYCAAVGINPKPLIDEFMDIYTGNRDTGIKDRPAVAAPIAPPPAEMPPAEETQTAGASAEDSAINTPPAPETVADEPADLFTAQDTPDVSVIPDVPVDNPPTTTHSPSADDHAFSRYAAPVRTYGERPSISPTVWRMGLLAVGALVLLTLIILGLRSLRSAVGVRPDDATAETAIEDTPVEVPQATDAPASKPSATPRTAQKIPALYID